MSQTPPIAESFEPLAPPRVASETPDDEGRRQITWLLERLKPSQARPHHYLMLLRFALVNLIASALLAAAYLHGLVDRVLIADQTNLSVAIFLVFLGGLVICTWKILQASRELNQVKSLDPLTPSAVTRYLARLRGRSGNSRAIFATTLRLRLTQRIAVVRHIAGSLVLLGLIGTVLGFIIALSGVDPQRASDVKAIAPMISTLIAGMSTALYTTLVGAVLNVWLMVDYRLLASGTVKLITALVELGEDDGRS